MEADEEERRIIGRLLRRAVSSARRPGALELERPSPGDPKGTYEYVAQIDRWRLLPDGRWGGADGLYVAFNDRDGSSCGPQWFEFSRAAAGALRPLIVLCGDECNVRVPSISFSCIAGGSIAFSKRYAGVLGLTELTALSLAFAQECPSVGAQELRLLEAMCPCSSQ